MIILLRLGACCALGMVLAALLLIGLLVADQRELLRALVSSGEPLAGLLLWALPESLWEHLSGVADAALHPALAAFLTLGSALAQLAVLAGLSLYRLWYAR